MNRILLRKGRERSVLKGHPWVFSGAVESGDASAGELVEVCDSKGGKIALGWYSPASQIRVRIVPGAPVADYFARRIADDEASLSKLFKLEKRQNRKRGEYEF